MSIFIVLPLVFLSTYFVLIFIRREHETFAKRASRHVVAAQSMHSQPTPRIGGIAIAVGTLSGALLSGIDVFGLILWTTLPIFIAGTLEDIGPETPPSFRLGVAALSAVLAIALIGEIVPRVGVPGFDLLFEIGFVSISFTILASAGMTHAMNLIDGLNGLAAMAAIIILGAFVYLAYTFGHDDLFQMNLIIIIAFVSFMFLNFPSGKIFLGDAGAYSVGHIIAWNAIILMNREPSISPWAILLILSWPVVDTLFAMFRRFSNGKPVGNPDKLHFHHVVMRLLGMSKLRPMSKEYLNPIASLITWPLMFMPVFIGVIVYDSEILSVLCFILFVFAYIFTFRFLVRRAKLFR